MGITVCIEDQEGRTLKKIADDEKLWILESIIPTEFNGSSYKIIKYIDLYGDTTFNSMQMEDFLKDWAKLNNKFKTKEEISLYKKVKEAAEEVRNTSHIFLKFYGD